MISSSGREGDGKNWSIIHNNGRSNIPLVMNSELSFVDINYQGQGTVYRTRGSLGDKGHSRGQGAV